MTDIDLDAIYRAWSAASDGKRTLNGDGLAPVDWHGEHHLSDVAIAYRNIEREDYDHVTDDLVAIAMLDRATVLELVRRAMELEKVCAIYKIELVGVGVDCTVCGLRKKPRGRSAPLEMANSLCDHECEGYNKDPKPGDLWPGEKRAEFGYP